MSCECGHQNKDHEIRRHASGEEFLRCKALGIERRPIEPGATTSARHYNCPCKIDITTLSDEDIWYRWQFKRDTTTASKEFG